MVVICEKCGKKYRVDPVKIMGKAASFNCHVCSDIIMVFKAQATPPQPASKMKTPSATTIVEPFAAEGAIIKESVPLTDETEAVAQHRRKSRGFGLRAKMILLFFFIPSLLTAGASLYYLGYFENFSHLFLQESAQIVVQQSGEKSVNPSSDNETMQPRSKVFTGNARKIALVMLSAALLLIGIIVLVYANRLTGKIESLTDVAERINAGDFEIKIEMKSRDEIGELAQAITRMRDKIRVTIEKLQQHP
jgi:HAMP domain-containing protein